MVSTLHRCVLEVWISWQVQTIIQRMWWSFKCQYEQVLHIDCFLGKPTSQPAHRTAHEPPLKRPHFRELTTTTGVQLDNPLAANSEKIVGS